VGWPLAEEVLSTVSDFLEFMKKVEAAASSLPPSCRGRLERLLGLMRAYASALEEIEDKVRLGEELEDWDRLVLAGLPSVVKATEEALEDIRRRPEACT